MSRARRSARRARAAAAVFSLLTLLTAVAAGQESRADPEKRFKHTGSRRPYAHHIPLHDAGGRPIDPEAERPPPYSPRATCRGCHDVDVIAEGLHFGSPPAAPGRPGEPWILVDGRTATWLPISRHAGGDLPSARAAGLEPVDFVRRFGRHMTGDGPAAAPSAGPGGALEIDCMACHAADRSWSHERWAEQIARGNLAWAPTAALGLGSVSGAAKDLDGYDPAADGGVRLPGVRYDRRRFGPDGTVFFDVVRSPPDAACHACHGDLAVGEGAEARWRHDGDVHLTAGMSCVDCHPNGLAHHTVRGHPGERHPGGASVAVFSCRGCHLGEDGGRFGAPRPEHAGLPPLHLEELSCTACHAGPVPRDEAGLRQTPRAHGLGLASQTRDAGSPPHVVAPVFRRRAGVIAPFRQVWPAFWGWERDGEVTPIPPAEVGPVVRRTMRVRRDLAEEVAPEELDAKLARALAALAASPPDPASRPVYVAGGRIHRLAGGDGAIERGIHPAGAPRAWAIGHDVRPARHSLGAGGCDDCHAAGSPIYHGRVVARGPIPDPDPPASAMHELMGEDPVELGLWERSFAGREAFQWYAAATLLVVALVVVAQILLFGQGIAGFLLRRRPPRDEER